MQLEGVIPPMVTPTIDRAGDVNVEVLRTFTEALVDGGVHGLFPCGSNGEFTSFTREERATVIETVADAADGAVPVIAGCGGTAVDEVAAYIDDATEAGADAAVVVTPYYLTTTDKGMRDFYEAVADRSPLPVVIYNIPQLTKHSLGVETVAALAEDDRFVGVKDSSGNVTYHNRLLAETPDEFAVIQGITGLGVAALDAGGSGMIAGPANVFPAQLSEIYDAHRSGDRGRAVELMNTVANPLANAFAGYPTASAMKYLTRLAGHDVGPPRAPLPTLTERQRRRLKRAYESVLESTRVTA